MKSNSPMVLLVFAATLAGMWASARCELQFQPAAPDASYQGIAARIGAVAAAGAPGSPGVRSRGM